jgi:NAD(P)-dependent dehydrogenase (short-subunit alcohol dehydrogenase family)
MKKVAMITGASSGFGLLTSVELAKNGFYVIATMRNMAKKKKVLEYFKDQDILENVECTYLDVTDADSIISLAKRLESFPRIDLLINNAGYALGGFAEEIIIEDYEQIFATNVIGVMKVTKAILPIMRKQGFGKIINISSISGRIGIPGMSPYVSSKFALEGYTESLRLEVQPFGIEVALVEPGSYQTNIWDTSLKRSEMYMNKNSPYSAYIEAIHAYIHHNKPKYGNPKDVANLIVTLACKEKLHKLRYPIGSGVKMSLFMKNVLPWKWWEKLMLKNLLK